MFKSLFKSAKSDVRTIAVSSDAMVVEQIHKEFNTAADYVYAEAERIINGTNKEAISKIERLQKVGFKKSADVTTTKTQIAVFEQSKEKAKILTYYRMTYPNNKFIYEEDVVRICKKYGLLCGPCSSFIGVVPEKNLRDIEKFFIKSEDTLYKHIIKSVDFRYNANDSSKRLITQVARTMKPVYNSNTRMSDSDMETILSEECRKQGISANSISSVNVKSVLENEFMICAPAKDFDDDDLELDGSFLNKSHDIIFKTDPIPDPVILRKAKHGYLIVTAWGLEASDPIIVNEKMN